MSVVQTLKPLPKICINPQQQRLIGGPKTWHLYLNFSGNFEGLELSSHLWVCIYVKATLFLVRLLIWTCWYLEFAAQGDIDLMVRVEGVQTPVWGTGAVRGVLPMEGLGVWSWCKLSKILNPELLPMADVWMLVSLSSGCKLVNAALRGYRHAVQLARIYTMIYKNVLFGLSDRRPMHILA